MIMDAQNPTPTTISSPPPPPEDSPSHQNDNNAIEKEAVVNARILKSPTCANDDDDPPVDDCCPICFGSFFVPCKADCGHWFCGGCVIQYWKYSGTSKACKCPICSSTFNKLTPQVFFPDSQEQELITVLQDIQRYNRLFIGGVRGVVERARELPFFMKGWFADMMDPHGRNRYLHENILRLLALLLALLYISSPYKLIPLGELGIARLFEHCSVLFLLGLRLVGLHRRERLNQRVRTLAAAEPIQGQ